MSEQRIRRHVIVQGRVQGVYFRGATQEQALARGVDGWVRNLADGSVEAVFEGAGPAVQELVDFCRDGPRWARVAAVEVTEEQPESLSGFRVRS